MPPVDTTPVLDSDTVVHIDNTTCQITSESPSELHCVTRGKVGTTTLFILGTLLIYGSIGFFAWSLPSGRLQLLLLITGALTFLIGAFFQWRGMVRRREMGTYVINHEDKTIRQGRGGRGWTFDAVSHLRLVQDVSDLTRLSLLPRFPTWLFVHLKDGKRIRIAKGSQEELQPILDWLQQAGVRNAE